MLAGWAKEVEAVEKRISERPGLSLAEFLFEEVNSIRNIYVYVCSLS